MVYALLLWPHTNGRYEEAIRRPAIAELQILLHTIGTDVIPYYRKICGVNSLCFEAPEIPAEQLKRISGHSLFYLLAEWREPENTLIPLVPQPDRAIGFDLASVQKYKGKTNERFTDFLINMALYSSAFAKESKQLRLLDPMCGRGTTLFQAVNRGWNATGLDTDSKEISGCDVYFEKYLQYHKIKYKKSAESRTVPGASAVKMTCFNVDQDAETLEIGTSDAALVHRIWKEERFHLICCDLPYGVQHAPSGQGGAMSFENTLKRALPAWYAALKRGGAAAISFNVFTLKTERARELMEEAGFTAMRGGIYDETEHWVEQAITRDIAVGIKK